MLLKHILQHKGTDVFTIDPTSNLQQVAERLIAKNCGSLVVTENDKLAGIITERDLLRAIAAKGGLLEDLQLDDYLTREVVTGSPELDIEGAMDLMTTRRIRHLPVLEGERIVGIVSIGDLVKAHRRELSVENRYLKEYIQS